MAKIYVYVNGADLHELEEVLLKQFTEFCGVWGVRSARVINDRYPRTPDLSPDELPDWNLGINADEAFSHDKVEQLIQFLTQLATESGREFVIGACDPASNFFEDWCFIGSERKQYQSDFLVERLNEP